MADRGPARKVNAFTSHPGNDNIVSLGSGRALHDLDLAAVAVRVPSFYPIDLTMRRPLVLINGILRELPDGEELYGAADGPAGPAGGSAVIVAGDEVVGYGLGASEGSTESSWAGAVASNYYTGI